MNVKKYTVISDERRPRIIGTFDTLSSAILCKNQYEAPAVITVLREDTFTDV